VESTFHPLFFLHYRPFSYLRTWWDGVKEDVRRGRVECNWITEVHLEGWPLNQCVSEVHLFQYILPCRSTPQSWVRSGDRGRNGWFLSSLLGITRSTRVQSSSLRWTASISFSSWSSRFAPGSWYSNQSVNQSINQSINWTTGYKCMISYSSWRGEWHSHKGVGLAIKRLWVQFPAIPLSCSDSRKVVHTHVPLSPNIIPAKGWQ